MGQAYSAGLTVTDSIILRKERLLPLKGTVLVKKGDKVLYGKYSGTEVTIDGVDYLIMRESDIFAII